MAKATKASTKKRSSQKASAKRARGSTRRAAAARKPSRKTAKTAAKRTTKASSKKTARKPAKKTARKPAKKTAKKAARKSVRTPAAKRTTTKRSAKKTARKPASKSARKPTKKPAKKTAKKTSRKPAVAKKTAAKKPAAKTARKPAKKTSGRSRGKRVASGSTQASWNAVGAAPAPTPLPVAVDQKQAPKKFQRQYKTWLRRLIGLRRRLLGETSQLEEEALKAGENDVSIDHMADYGSDSFEQEFTLSLIESKSEALRDVDDAIRKIEIRTYGLCEECETLIPKGRLEVLPHTRLCIECKSAQESASGF